MGGICHGRYLSRGYLSGGFCSGGFCTGGFCPDTLFNILLNRNVELYIMRLSFHWHIVIILILLHVHGGITPRLLHMRFQMGLERGL